MSGKCRRKGGGCLTQGLGLLLVLGGIITGIAYYIHSYDINQFMTRGREIKARVQGKSKLTRTAVGEGRLTRTDDMVCVTSEEFKENDKTVCTTLFLSGELVKSLSPGDEVLVYYRHDIHEMILAKAVEYRSRSVFFSYTHLILFFAGLMLMAWGRVGLKRKER